MDTRRFGSDFSDNVGRAVLILVLVILFVIGLGVVSGPIMARREAEMKDKHIRSIEQLVEAEDWSGVKDYLSDNDLYDFEYQKYLDVYNAQVQVGSIEGSMSHMEKYAKTPISEYYTEKDCQAKIRSEAEDMVVDMQRCYSWLYLDVYDRGIEGNEKELLEHLTVLEECMVTYGFTEEEMLGMYRDDTYQFDKTILYQEMVEKVVSYYITQ